ncbi:hypothetical protein LTR62_008152 [Meristemomyces frigidus]|uniref:Major facilitator superfamily (MFS) profile domain-containing protein n=1 Tax=Meristemomyces frigidus TaxID=1508187 RepID=A0AAN7YD15_9PEZI|nr:hypothetical protein LTR62_008152 [Meristemomyces frigidus]
MNIEREKGKSAGTTSLEASHLERSGGQGDNLVYDDPEGEPELHVRTYAAVTAMFLLNLVQVFALQGPPVVLSYIGKDLNATASDTWVPNALSLVQAVWAPAISSASDAFQARKLILVGTCLVSFVGAAIAPGAKSIGRLIAAQTLIGVGFAAVPLAYTVPSEILPRRWRPMVQGSMNVAASLGACAAPLVIGGFTRSDPEGWRTFYWVQMALWGATAAGIFMGYRPPKRHTRLDHLSIWQKIGHLDLAGMGLLTTGLTLLLVGLNLGGGLYAWTNVRVLATLIIGILVLISFALYEWKGTKTGIIHHELFRNNEYARTFAICVALIFIEAILLFSYIIFYPVLTTNLFTEDPFLLAARAQPFWIVCGLSTMLYGTVSTKLRSIRLPMLFGFVIFTGGIVGLSTIEPNDSTNAVVFAGLAGLGFGAPLVLVISGVQLSTPHHLIATATAITTSARAVGATTFTAIFSAVLTTRLDKYIPNYIAKAAVGAGLPRASVPALISALTSHNATATAAVSGVSPAILAASGAAVKQAFMDGLRVVYIIAAPFGVVACILCFFFDDLSQVMNYRVDAPVEDLRTKSHH